MRCNKILAVIDLFILVGIYLGDQIKSENLKKPVFWETIPLSAESFTGYISIPKWIIIMSKLENFENWGRFSSGDLVILLLFKKKTLCVCVCVSVSGYAFRISYYFDASSRNSVGWQGPSPQGVWSTFRSDFIKGQRSSRGQVAFKMPYGNQIW